MPGNFGFIHEKYENKILILFILRRLPEPIGFDKLTELTMCDEGISYFDYAQCVVDLVENGNVKLEGDKYSLTVKGARNSAIMEKSLPFTVRMEAEAATHSLRTEMNRNSMIKTSHEQNENGGYTVALSMSDGVGDVVSINLLAMNERQALELESGFRNNAEGIYNSLIGTILADR